MKHIVSVNDEKEVTVESDHEEAPSKKGRKTKEQSYARARNKTNRNEASTEDLVIDELVDHKTNIS